MNAQVTVTITRWMLLRVWPAAWREVLREYALPAWHPYALVLFVVGAWSLMFARGER